MNKSIFYLKLGGLLIVLFTVYWRFLRPRAQGTIDLTYSDLKLILYCISILSLTVGLLLIVLVPLLAKKLRPKLKEKNFLSSKIFKLQLRIFKLSYLINKYYNKMLREFYLPIYIKRIQKNKKNKEIFEKLINFIENYPMLVFELIITFYFLPPCIISFTYFLEVVIYRYFTYFPIVIFLMIFPIGIRVFLFTLRLHSEEIEKELSKHVLKVKKDGKEGYTWQRSTDIPLENLTDAYLLKLATLRENNLINLQVWGRYQKSFIFLKEEYFLMYFLYYVG